MANDSVFLTADLSAIIKNPAGNVNNLSTARQQTKPANYDWARDLQNRHATNKTAHPDFRKNTYEVEQQFFTDFFNNMLKSEALTKKAMAIGELLRSDIKTLGFKIAENPILAFLSIPFVQHELLGTSLLNIATYRAIHNAVAKHLVADSEFYKFNLYNIIYCQDLYRHSAAEIEQYLEQQTKILNPKASRYEPSELALNRGIFFYVDIKGIKETDIDGRIKAIKNMPVDNLPSNTAKLNTNSFINKFIKSNNIAVINSPERDGLVDDEPGIPSIKTLIRSIKPRQQPALAFAALQFISLTTGLAEAKQALKHKAFTELRIEQITQATNAVSNILGKYKLQKSDAKALVTAIIDQLG